MSRAHEEEDPVEVDAEHVSETAAAFLVKIPGYHGKKDREVWLPKSATTWDGKTTFTVDYWLAFKEGLI